MPVNLEPVIRATSISKAYRGQSVLDDVSLSVARGEVVSVVGQSGAGKSTLLHCLAGIVRPDTGSVSSNGRPLEEMSDSALSRLRRTSFGVLFQFGQLIPELTACENVALPLLIEGRRRRDALDEARGVLTRFRVGDLGERKPSTLSGGQSQRVALARAVVMKPSVVFADEPTGALDSLSARQVLEELFDLASSLDTAVVLVTHDASVAACADRVVEIRDGVLS
jgi:putative ABC transport system ATP-binding protein